jgi:thymidylate kinase
MLVPQPRLWILLDAPAEVLQARKQEVPLEETSRQCAAYRAFVRSRRDFVIVDAAQSLDLVVADVARAITKTIAQGKNNHG